MSGVHIDSERLAESASGRPSWTEAEAGHLATCAECRLELEMLGAARRLGSVPLAELDLGRVTAQVRRRLGAEPAIAPRRGVGQAGRWLLGLAAAAAVVLAVRTGLPSGPGGSTPTEPASVAQVSVLHELDELSEPQLEEVLRSIAPASEALDHVEMVPLDDLTTGDLERVLRSMEE